MTEERVLITRESAEAGKPGRVFVTGPHFSRGVYSSTTDRHNATLFTRAEAERLLAVGTWRGNAPRIEPQRKDTP